jgi:hypothetical protein
METIQIVALIILIIFILYVYFNGKKIETATDTPTADPTTDTPTADPTTDTPTATPTPAPAPAPKPVTPPTADPTPAPKPVTPPQEKIFRIPAPSTLSTPVTPPTADLTPTLEKIFRIVESEKKTPLNASGDAEAIYLDRHDIDCNGRAINQFRLIEGPNNTMGYIYKCSDNGNLQGEIDTKQTNYDYRGPNGGKVQYLDRHQVTCGPNKVLSRFKLFGDGGENWQYRYTCNESQVPLTCETKTTESSILNGVNVNLSDHNIICDSDQALAEFQLKSMGGAIYYNYKCCK